MNRPNNLSVLAVTAAPDDRRSTRNLEMILDEIARRPGHRVQLWYLRCWEGQTARTDSKVVDQLRTWLPVRLLDSVGLTDVAARLRGARLRLWLRVARPDLVVLDDGIGARVLDPLTALPPVVVRLNELLPDDAPAESVDESLAALVVLCSERADEAAQYDVPTALEYPFADHTAKEFASGAVRRRARVDRGLPADVPLVVGWGDDGWLDGPDVFIRTLWCLEARHGIVAHGAWFGLSSDQDESRRLQQEAVRVGLATRFHLRPDDSTAGRLCGDAVLFPYRGHASAEDARAAVLSGAGVVAFAGASLSDPAIRVVPDLDVEAAAAALADALAEDREARWADARRRVDVELLTDQILSLAGD